MTGIVDDDIQPARIGDDVCDAGLGRGVRLHVEFSGAQIGLVLSGPCGDGGDLGRIAPVVSRIVA
jgi:hypothetical protein